MKKGYFLLFLAVAGAAYSSSRELSVATTPETIVKEENKIPPATIPIVPKEIAVNVTPAAPIQGEPVLVSVKNLSGTTTVSAISFNSKKLGVFKYENEPSALIGLDLRMTPGNYPLSITLSNGKVINKNISVGKRPTVEAPLGIPESLGGNTPESEKELLNTLAQEGAIINAIPSGNEKLWDGAFRLPISPPIIITDTYGYSRLTGASTIAHKGTDYRAAVGTPVYAINSGKVAYKGNLRNYGNVIAVDHGLGLLSIYMHLSQVLLNEGDLVSKGDKLALSGETGYVLGPHLHLTIRINQISIDPEKFLSLMGN